MRLLQFLVSGVALGAAYGLISLGFVVIYKATRVISLAQGGLVLLGAYLVYSLHVSWGIPFYPSLLIAAVGTAAVASAIGRVIVQRMVGQPVFSVIMVTIGFLYVIQQLSSALWGDSLVFLQDPWGARTVAAGRVTVSVVDLWTIAFAVVLFLAFLAFFRYSIYGIAMRASARDPEAAAAQGVSTTRVVLLSWAIAGAVAALAGVMLSSGSQGLSPDLSTVAFAALPAMVLGGLDSPLGAVVGGVVLGVAEVMSAGYAGDLAPYLGENFYKVMPYLGMIAILIIRPQGLFGSREVERI